MFKNRNRKPNIIFLLSIVLLVIIILWNYRSIFLVSQLTIETLRQGEVKHEKLVTGIFANTEVVVTSPVEGKITMILEQGRRLGKGEVIAELESSGVNYSNVSEKTSVIAPISGLFYPKLDSLESVVTPENLMNMELAKILEQVEKSQGKSRDIQNKDSGIDNDGQDNQAALNNDEEIGEEDPDLPDTSRLQVFALGQAINKNAPVGKIVNNLYPSWMFVKLENADTMAKGDFVKFVIDDEKYTGQVMKISENPRGAVVRFPQYIRGTTEDRVQEIIWQYKPASKGLVVPVEALCTYGEERGVYIVNQQIIKFKNVRVIDYNDQLACIEGIPEGTMVVVNPTEGIEGLSVKI